MGGKDVMSARAQKLHKSLRVQKEVYHREKGLQRLILFLIWCIDLQTAISISLFPKH